MPKFRWAAATALCWALAAPALAGEKPLYQPAPAWVLPPLAVEHAAPGADAPALAVVDTQERLESGTVWSYHDVATRMATPEIVQQAGTVALPWQPAKGDLIVHKIEIIRGAQHIDALAGGKTFQVIRREQQLERFAIDGELTATLPVEGLQVGDVLRVVATISQHEPALGGSMQDVVVVPTAPLPVGVARTRLVWPAGSGVRYRLMADGKAPTVNRHGTDEELVVTGLLPKPEDLPGDAPLRFRRIPLLEVSSFADWQAVSKVMAPYYAVAPLTPGSDLERQIGAIKAASPDLLHRADAALQLVQDKVRYLYNGLDKGNYVPQSAAQTWTARYGDCKAKTLLLLTALHELGIEAEPVLASTEGGDLVPGRLPSAAAFNHVIVHATIAGRDYWLDGTSSGTRYADLGDVPPFRWVLPLRATGAGLVEVPLRAPSQPLTTIALDLDQRAGVEFPTIATLTTTVRGPVAAMYGLAKTQGSKDDRDRTIQQMVTTVVGGDTVPTGYTIDYDPIAAVATIKATSTATNLWRRENERWRLVLDKTVSNTSFEPDRARPAWQSIPVATGRPDRSDVTVTLRLPGDGHGYSVEGDARFTDALAATTIERSVTQADTTIAVHDRIAVNGGEIAPAAVSAMRARVALAKSRLLTVVAPSDLPPRWQAAKQGRSDGRFKPVLAAYTAAITADPKSVDGYANRARFLEGIYDYATALRDIDQVVAIEPNAERYRWRASIEESLGLYAKALADHKAAAELEPNSLSTIELFGSYLARRGESNAALALADQGIAQGGKARAAIMARKADFLARSGDRAGALQQLDQAVVSKPGDPSILNQRCWIKAQLATQLDTALKDCTQSIELSDSPAAALDSRALVYFRLGRLDAALADLDAALAMFPSQASSLYLRGIVLKRQGKQADSDRELAAAAMIDPRVADDYRPFGIAP